VNGETQQLAENAKDALIFTTSGTGMVGLPMRFRTPPRIDVLNVSWRACEAAR
jgi:predicted MPP superfamily phosphohydrolase